MSTSTELVLFESPNPKMDAMFATLETTMRMAAQQLSDTFPAMHAPVETSEIDPSDLPKQFLRRLAQLVLHYLPSITPGEAVQMSEQVHLLYGRHFGLLPHIDRMEDDGVFNAA